jgi:hypothetical protein
MNWAGPLANSLTVIAPGTDKISSIHFGQEYGRGVPICFGDDPGFELRFRVCRSDAGFKLRFARVSRFYCCHGRSQFETRQHNDGSRRPKGRMPNMTMRTRAKSPVRHQRCGESSHTKAPQKGQVMSPGGTDASARKFRPQRRQRPGQPSGVRDEMSMLSSERNSLSDPEPILLKLVGGVAPQPL